MLLLIDQETDCCAAELLTTHLAGCLLAEELTTSLIHVIRAVVAGETVFSRAVVAKLVEAEHSVAVDGAAFGLTEREADVLELMARGYSNGEIASTLCLLPQTVRNKASRIYSKMGVGSRVELLAWARQQGLG